MQIIDKGGKVTVKLDQAEGRRLRDASYILKRIAANVPDPFSIHPVVVSRPIEGEAPEVSISFAAVADMIKLVADMYTPAKSQEKLDKQDGENVPTDPPPPRAA